MSLNDSDLIPERDGVLQAALGSIGDAVIVTGAASQQSLTRVFRDITERRRLELRAAWLASIVESSDDAIVSKDIDGRITSRNPSAERLFGYAESKIVGKAPPEFFAPADVPGDLRCSHRAA